LSQSFAEYYLIKKLLIVRFAFVYSISLFFVQNCD